MFIPQVRIFKRNNKKWKRPLSVDLRNMITDKKHTWTTFIKTRNSAILLKYKRISNIVRNQARNLQRKDQTDTALQCKTNPTKFWNFFNSKLKNKISNLSFKNSIGIEVITNNVNTKAEIQNNFFTSVFVKEDKTEFTHLNHISIPHKRLLSKLYSYNINEDIIKWIQAYLDNRTQRVKNYNSYFNWATVISGIPHGSIIGPLLFIIYINEQPVICDSGSRLFL